MSILTRTSRPSPRTPSSEGHKIDPLRGQERRGYGRPFWLAYVSNFLISVAVSVLYRYADFVRLLGGSEYQLGWIVGVGMVGSLIARLALGSGIDRQGPKAVWLLSLLAFTGICWAHLWVERPDTPAIYLLRVAYCLSVAGIFGAAMTFVSSRMSVVRMAEMIAMLGTAGFMGMVGGAMVGDWLCSTEHLTRTHGDRLFIAAGLIGLGAMFFAALATSEVRPPVVRHRQPPLGYLLLRYNPGFVLVVAMIAGIGLGWPSIFLPTYAAELGIPRIGGFFAVYSITAVLTRVIARQWPARFGLRPLLVGSLGVIAGSQLLFLLVRNEWTLLVPGLTYGMGHAILFPTVVASGCQTFPERCRGLATMLVMSAFDLGTMLGAPLLGTILHHASDLGLPAYPSLFVLMGMALTAALVGHGLFSRRAPAKKSRSRGGRPPQKQHLHSSPAQGIPSPCGVAFRAEVLRGVAPADIPSETSQPDTPARISKGESPSREGSRESPEKLPAKQPLHQAG